MLRASTPRRCRLHIALASILVLVGGTLGCDDHGSVTEDPDPTERFEAQFEAFWATFDRNYSYFEYKQIDWDAIRQTFEPQVQSIRTQRRLIDLFIKMVEPLRDGHVYFVQPDGVPIYTHQITEGLNFDSGTWLLEVQSHGWVQVRRNLGYARFEGIPYIAVGAWNADDFSVEDLDSIIDRFQNAPAIIIDVRPNRGGDSRLADGLAGRFADSKTLTGYFQFRNGPEHGDFEPLRERYLEPRGSWQYTGPVAVLAGRASQSSSEGFVSAMRELPNVTVIGDTTGGASGNPAFFELEKGWRYSVSRWMHTTADGLTIEWNGIPPDIDVTGFEDGIARGEDVVLDFAVDWALSQ